MPRFSLEFERPESLTREEARSRFVWTSSGADSFVSSLLPRYTTLGPGLGALGPVPRANVDLVHLAVLVCAADRSTPRRVRGSNWSQRDLLLDVPVSDPAPWEVVKEDLQALLGFLSGDAWTLDFYQSEPPEEQIREARFAGASRAVLLSGGADSAVGALLSRYELADAGASHVLVSHVGLTTLAPYQRRIAEQVEQLLPGPTQHHQQIHLTRRQRQFDRTPFRNETSTRARSLLFLALGLAVASVERVPLWIPENGFASLNLPLTPDQRGSLSTRTTHPLFLEGLAKLAAAAGAHADITNPLANMTKGEMFARVGELVGQDAASDFLSSTHSCGHTGQRSYRLPVDRQCGVCFGCLLRRASFLAAGLKDKTDYVRAESPAVEGYLRSKSMQASLRAFLSRGLRPVDLASLALPESYSLAAARNICTRAIAELELLNP